MKINIAVICQFLSCQVQLKNVDERRILVINLIFALREGKSYCQSTITGIGFTRRNAEKVQSSEEILFVLLSV